MRIKRGVSANKRRVKIRKLSKGYWGAKHKNFRIAREAVVRSEQYAFVGRKNKKRDFRKLWIARINAGARAYDLSYSKLMHGLKLANIELNRKVLADLAATDQKAFGELCETAKKALNA